MGGNISSCMPKGQKKSLEKHLIPDNQIEKYLQRDNSCFISRVGKFQAYLLIAGMGKIIK